MGRIRLLITSSVLLAAGVFGHQAQAAPTVFIIDNSKSLILVSGFFSAFAITQQGAGALGASYSGSINANVSGSTIQFPGSSAIIAHTNGVWQPAVGGVSGTAPADYGPQASVNYSPFGIYTFYGAMRNISFDVASPVLPVTGTNFNGTNLVFSFASANAALDYYSSIKEGSVALGGYATNTVAVGSSLTTNGSTQTLFIPISAQFVFTLLSANDSTLHVTGQIVATNTLTVVPPVIQSIEVTNQSVVVAAVNATGQSQLLVSTNLATWSPASVTITTNNSGWIIFTTPLNGSQAFFRVQQ